ncbi:MAG: GNAT family N-acetyltransferase [Spirosomaceae bacterium]|jgi:RimJ/RimL family protein N-acetyltransferase|nr:GNAT family N-acetyltransferase [Spirosomataceae bacterium]
MFRLQSARLQLIPLNLDQLLLYKNDYAALCRSLGVEPLAIVMEEVFQAEFDDALVNYWIPQTAANQTDYRWFTNWLMVENGTNVPVGGIGVAGLPNDEGETEIGYGLGIAHRGKGYATEALALLSHWVLSHGFVKAIIAHTPVDLKGSQRVLEKVNFKKISENEGIVLWRKEI